MIGTIRHPNIFWLMVLIENMSDSFLQTRTESSQIVMIPLTIYRQSLASYSAVVMPQFSLIVQRHYRVILLKSRDNLFGYI